jgi:hypothetical protein
MASDKDAASDRAGLEGGSIDLLYPPMLRATPQPHTRTVISSRLSGVYAKVLDTV